jgi:integrase
MQNHGSGTIYQRKDGNKLWVAQIVFNNKRVSQSFPTQAEAEDWLKKMGLFINNTEEIINVITLKEYLDLWLNAKDPNLDTHNGSPEAIFRQRLDDLDETKIKDTTFGTYCCMMNLQILPRVPEQLLLISAKQADFKDILRDARIKEVGARTRQAMRNILHKACEDAVALGFISTNPLAGIKVKYKTPTRGKLTFSQARHLIALTKGSRYHNIIIIALISGCRMGELLGLKWDDVDFEGRVIYITKQMQRVQRRNNGTILAMTDPKTENSKRTIALGKNALNALRNQQVLLAAEKHLAGKRWKENNLVFPSSIGTPMEQANLRKKYQIFLAQAEIDPSIHFHDLRHASISATLSSLVGADVATTMKRSGHTQSRTLDTYTHAMVDDEDIDVADKLDDVFLGDYETEEVDTE